MSEQVYFNDWADGGEAEMIRDFGIEKSALETPTSSSSATESCTRSTPVTAPATGFLKAATAATREPNGSRKRLTRLFSVIVSRTALGVKRQS
jgi:hypothetical protein